MSQELFHTTKIRDHVFQIMDPAHAYCTLVLGDQRALLIDTCFGIYSLRNYIETIVTTPYDVINTHIHPDHMLGNYQFDSVYVFAEDMKGAKDLVLSEEYTKESNRLKMLTSNSDPIILTPEQQAQYLAPRTYHFEPVNENTIFDLGKIHARLVKLPGHTRGSIGILLEEDELLIAGDAFNTYLWMFFPESTSLKEYQATLSYALKLPFQTFLCGHSDQEFTKDALTDHNYNIEHLELDETTKEDIMEFEVYHSTYKTDTVHSCIFYSKDKL